MTIEEKAKFIEKWFFDNKRITSQAKVAKVLGMAPGTLSTSLNMGRCEGILDKTIAYIEGQGVGK